jgi:alkyl hydroperoxide reductase subunit AhpC
LIGDPKNSLAAKVGAVREQHWAGPMVHATTYLVDSDAVVRWRFQSEMAQRRPSPILLAEMAGAVAKKQPVPDYRED